MKVCFLSVEPIADQPRIRRQADALHDAGHEVVAIGASGARSPAPRWRVVELDLGRTTGVQRAAMAAAQMCSALGPAAARWAYWRDPRRGRVLHAAQAEAADVYVAREWRTMPIAVRACDTARTPRPDYMVDSPELSAEESLGSRSWRWFFRPMVVAIERRHLPGAALVTAVNGPIGEILQQRYRLADAPTVVRNMPPYEAHPPRPPDGRVRVLYLGGILPGRGVEQIIDSARSWPAHWDLTLMGPVSDAYRAELLQRIGSNGAVSIAPPVPLTEMVGRASQFDVGVFAHQPNGRQAELALPNKLFEYLMAGLAVCVSDMSAMREVVRTTGAGQLIAAPFGAEQVTTALHQLVADGLAEQQRAARAAAQQLNWDVESRAYVAAFESAAGRSGRGG